MYELRAMKSPKHVLEAHQGAVTCVAEQNSVKVSIKPHCVHYHTVVPHLQSSRSSMKKGSSKKSGMYTHMCRYSAMYCI